MSRNIKYLVPLKASVYMSGRANQKILLSKWMLRDPYGFSGLTSDCKVVFMWYWNAEAKMMPEIKSRNVSQASKPQPLNTKVNVISVVDVFSAAVFWSVIHSSDLLVMLASNYLMHISYSLWRMTLIYMTHIYSGVIISAEHL